MKQCPQCEKTTTRISEFSRECAPCGLVFHPSDASLKRYIDDTDDGERLKKAKAEALRRVTIRSIGKNPFTTPTTPQP